MCIFDLCSTYTTAAIAVEEALKWSLENHVEMVAIISDSHFFLGYLVKPFELI